MRGAGIILLALALLTPAALAGDVTVYLTKAEALEHIFPEADRVVELRHLLTREETATIEDRLGRRLAEGGFYVYVAYRDDEALGYAVIVAEVGKVQPITHIVEVTPDGATGDVAVMIYRETHGAEVADDRFMDQYVGLTLEDPIRIDKDVINVAGATLSGHAICRGVRKALCVVTTVLLDRKEQDRAVLLADATPVLPAVETPDADGAALARTAARVDGLTHVVVERRVMGTLCRIDAWSEQPEAALKGHIKAALDEVTRWDDVLSNWRDGTPLAHLNASPVGEPVEVDTALMTWLIDSRRWSALTGGAFDPAVGSLVEVWGLNTGEPARPDDDHLQAARRVSGLHLLEIDAAGMTVTRTADVRLDPGASGKGFALDRAAGVLKVRGVQRALLSFRSTLLALGPPPGHDAWPVPVVHDGDGTTVTTVPLVRGALSVSGGTFHAFVDRDVSRGHVIDPLSGVPVESGRLAWVRHPSAAAADAVSTALLVRGILLPPVPLAQGAFLTGVSSPPAPWPR